MLNDRNGPGMDEADGTKPLRAWHYLALSLPYLGLLVPAFYARSSPQIAGMPFFYAYQFAWIFISAGLTAIVYCSITRGRS